MRKHHLSWLVAWLAIAIPALAADADPLANYYDNTLVWQNQATRAIGRIWLNRDGRYFAFYNVGPQSTPPGTNGPFQVQGREGSYTLRKSAAPYQLCLWPAAPRMRIGAEVARELHAEGACYRFTPREVGAEWNETADPLNRPYKFWLVMGR
jgi:hypothetical protein